MSIELLTENHGNEIEELLSLTSNYTKIISPFMGKNTCEKLSKFINTNKIKCKIITRFYREDFIQNVNSLDGLLSLLKAGAEIRALIDLHSKLYIFDNSYSIITSANYTFRGLYTNYELGVKLENEQEINVKCEEYFDNLWDRIEEYNKNNHNKAIITEELIEEEKRIVNISSSTRTSTTTNFNDTKQGAQLDVKPNQNYDLVEKIFSPSYKITEKNIFGYWLKFTSGSKNRHDPDKEYLDFENDFSKNKTFFPRQPIGIKAGDRLYLASISSDQDNVLTPIIMARCETEGFNKSNEITKRFDNWMNWMDDYPFYIICKNMEIIKGPVKNGISLLSVYRELLGKIYPSTFGNTDITFESIRKFHYQKDKLRITSIASEYINKELDKKFEQYGKIIIS